MYRLRRNLGFLAAALLAFALPSGEGPLPDAPSLEKIDAALARGLDALRVRQAADGGWHSEKYALLKPGVASTALIVELLSRLPAGPREKHADALARGLAFLQQHTDAHGAVGANGEWVEYPAYSTALTVQALVRVKPEGWAERVRGSIAWLCSAQNSEHSGCAPKNPAYGGWNPTGVQPSGVPFHADLSTTRYAVEALVAARDSAALTPEQAQVLAHALEAAALYAQRCQNFDPQQPQAGDGGFAFTATQTDLNKAGEAAARTGFRSYGSATADGVLLLNALLKLAPATASGGARRLAREAAREWLTKNLEFRHVPGFKDPSERRATGMVYYYRAAAARAVAGAGASESAAARMKLGTAVLAAQQEAGLFANPNDSMKEDEPLIATPLALETLLEVRGALHEP